MKPARSDTQARQNWDNHQPKRCGGRAPNSLWNKFIGSEKEVEDLPEVAPTYDIDVKICGRRIYYERASDPYAIPKRFRSGGQGRIHTMDSLENLPDSSQVDMEKGLVDKPPRHGLLPPLTGPSTSLESVHDGEGE